MLDTPLEIIADWRVLWAGALMAKIFFVLMISMVFFIIFGT